ncbi:hypothetical protein GCM10011491_35300 [Brucella endophytica]|uniref:Di-trans,poly-cis-decaprenylcistransferase n=1 Tax=Brucella endophytica TaxID=1963359 RepID=A0A916SK22_9HYPH|nr:hypothetical protein GCM10011491_35300 [Brucella endophytica]
MDYFEQFAGRYQHYKGGSWCYEDGCIYRGLQLLHEATGEKRWDDHLHRMADQQIGEDGVLAGYDPHEYNIDHILAGRVLFPMYEATGDNRYIKAVEHLAGQLKTHPRIPAGNYWHKKRYPHQLWLDGLYMGLPFQIEHGKATGRPDLISDALQQMATALALTANPGGLYVHGYDDSRGQSWADPVTGRSPALWGRSLGWLAMALVDCMTILPEDQATASLRKRTATMLNEVMNRQTENGLWMQVFDAPDLVGNYEETSASTMFAYALFRAARLKLLTGEEGDRALEAGRKALGALIETKLEQDTDGAIELCGIVHVAGLGGFDGNYRDGSPEYYLTEPVVKDDAKGTGPLMMAYAEALLLGVQPGSCS